MYNSPAAAIAPVVLALRRIVDRIAVAIAAVEVDAYGRDVVVFHARSFGVDAGEPFVATGIRSSFDASTTHGRAKGESSLALDLLGRLLCTSYLHDALAYEAVVFILLLYEVN